MSRLSYSPRNTNAERRARLDARDAELRERRMQEQQAEEAERQMIMQANLQAMAAGQQQYLNQQNARANAKAAMAQDREIRRRNRLDGIKARNAQQHAALMEQRRQQELAQDQAALTAERDAQLHGYGMEDATLQHGFNQQLAGQQHGFNQDMANLTNRHTMGRDRRLHGFNQQSAAQNQHYTMQNADASHVRGLENAHLANRFSQQAAHLQHGQALERAGVAHGMDMERDQFGFQLDQLGANAQQLRGQQDAIATQGRNHEDLSFANQLQQGNAIDERIARLKEEGWTLNPSMQAEEARINEEDKALRTAIADHQITVQDAGPLMEKLRERRRALIPTERPAVMDPEKEFNSKTYKEDGVRYALTPDGPPTLLHDSNQRMSSSSRGQQGAFNDDGTLTFEADQQVRKDVSKEYQDYRRNESMLAADGTTPDLLSETDWLRNKIPFMNPNVQQIYRGILQQMDAEKPKKPGGKTAPPGFMPLPGQSQPQQSSPQVEQHWRDAGANLLQGGQGFSGPRAAEEAWDMEIQNVERDPVVSRAMQGFPERAAPLLANLRGAMVRIKALKAENKDPTESDPQLVEMALKAYRDLKVLAGSGKPVNPMQQYADPQGEF